MSHTRSVSAAPCAIGILLWGAATALLLEEAIHAGRYDVATMATPILTAATVAAACLAHMRFARLCHSSAELASSYWPFSVPR